MLSGVHFILTYMCNSECDHCFLYGSPQAKGTFTLNQLKQVFTELPRIGTIESVYFEGGEPFLFYPLMVEGIKLAREMGFKTGIVTNAYWANSPKDAELWLKPLSELELSDLSVSEDTFHSDEEEESKASYAIAAAKKLGIPSSSICIEPPTVEAKESRGFTKGEPIVGGGVKFRGRAVDSLAEGLPGKDWRDFTECPDEDLKNPQRVHLDSFGNVHLCQGLSMGNMWKTPLSKLVQDYDCDSHPLCSGLARGGPAKLAREFGTTEEREYIDACHLCYLSRLKLLDRFPQYLGPKQVYGLQDDADES
jgi:MoaA/NifB/PqqE/SkfB family radical SAM enzyme